LNEYIGQEKQLILLADAGCQPGTVVVIHWDALILVVAVLDPQRLVKLTASTVSLILHHFVQNWILFFSLS